ncbi:baseplate J/gp47 family protein [Thermoleptolyngbya sp. M55_K2018_002]|uniref:baseplate J/gp47 family protein n=1 Tax=Thermoleptolyngbya sp. M55_K2018_002 TaxID=2747808 RepID=UPI0019D9E267|nr:baseplate J/gp47 family protein [Thermoleptolyngbya sp. M55_K2018_002]HIK42148.1 baseplate J/gp47 family protein [Thermoleptolyngbya sp. M55_K2018_002]
MVLERPNFIDRDPANIEAALIERWQEVSGRTLFPAQVERLWLNLLAYEEALHKLEIQYTAEQELVNYAVGVNLDQLGALVSTPRLAASFAKTTLQFTKGILGEAVNVPAGTRVQATNGVTFETDDNLFIGAGVPTGSAIATCTQPGTVGNGFTAGQINILTASVTGIISAANTTTSSGGAEIEADEPYRERVKLAPNLFTTAGSVGQYVYLTRQVSQLIVDVAVVSPARTIVQVYPLTADGSLPSELLDAITDALTAADARPICDDVTVLAPGVTNVSTVVEVVAYTTADLTELQIQLDTAIAQFAAAKKARLGQDLVRSQLVAALSLEGVYSVTVTSPASDSIVGPTNYLNMTGLTVTITGTNDG